MKAQTRNVKTIKIYVSGECNHFTVNRLIAGEILSPYGVWLNRKWTMFIKAFTSRESAEAYAATIE